MTALPCLACPCEETCTGDLACAEAEAAEPDCEAGTGLCFWNGEECVTDAGVTCDFCTECYIDDAQRRSETAAARWAAIRENEWGNKR